MKYSELKGVLKSGDIIALSHQPWKTERDVESHIVRIVTESEYSHVCVAYVGESGELQVIEAVEPVVTISQLTKYLDFGFYVISTPDKPMTKEEEAYGKSKLNQPYSKIEAVEGFLGVLDIAGDSKWMCAELTIAMRRLSGLDFKCRATPAEVVRDLLQRGYELKYVKAD